MAAHHAVPLASGHSAASMNSTLSGKGALLLHNSSSTLHALNGSNLTAAGGMGVQRRVSCVHALIHAGRGLAACAMPVS
jgi:hypothetical protein